nr:glycoside hydrolase family 92 protein [Deltaproteobacteria bacterium]
NWTSQPWTTQERIQQICRSMYRNAPDGLCGNDDCGQMSAWYIFSTLGFYPVCPGTTQYAIGSPSFSEASVFLSKGKKLSIRVYRQQEQDIYIQSVSHNGIPLQPTFLEHEELEKGGELFFIMGPTPREWE